MITVNLEGLVKVNEALSSINNPAIRKRILGKAGRQLVKAAKARVASQTDLAGAAFAPASGRKRRLLTYFAKRLAVVAFDENSATVGFKNGWDGNAAAKNQFGFVEKMLRSEIAKANQRRRQVDNNAMATRKQAKSLIDAGYKVRRPKDGMWTPSIKWITENVGMSKASLILRILRGPANDEFEVAIPPRSFLGVTDEDAQALLDILTTEVAAELAKRRA